MTRSLNLNEVFHWAIEGAFLRGLKTPFAPPSLPDSTPPSTYSFKADYVHSSLKHPLWLEKSHEYWMFNSSMTVHMLNSFYSLTQSLWLLLQTFTEHWVSCCWHNCVQRAYHLVEKNARLSLPVPPRMYIHSICGLHNGSEGHCYGWKGSQRLSGLADSGHTARRWQRWNAPVILVRSCHSVRTIQECAVLKEQYVRETWGC